MKAARFYEPGKPLQVEQVPEPVLKPGGAIVKVLSAHINSYTKDVLSGELSYPLPTPYPFTPGPSAIGVVEAVAEDVFGLEPGQKVFCEPFISSKTIGAPPDGILIGWMGLAPASNKIQSLWKDGSYTERAVWPAECLTPLGDAESIDSSLLACILDFMTVAYGGFLRGDLRPSQTLVVNGATGNLGASAVLAALAMGVSKIVAVGRDENTLEKLRQLDPKRIEIVPLTGSTSDNSERIKTVAGGGADMVLDALGTVYTPEPTMACINALRPRGTAVFIGGAPTELPLSYVQIMLQELTIRGSFMYPRHVPGDILRMINGGILDFNAVKVHAFSLDDINDAIAKAPNFKGLEYCAIVP
jgi:alcohol dehydrogenase